jgi:orotate phosphoribosyltransferase-like protein
MIDRELRREQVYRLKARGYVRNEIASRLRVSLSTVRDDLAAEGARARVQSLREEHGDPDALDFLRDVMQDTSQKMSDRLQAAKVLALGGVPQDIETGPDAEGTGRVTINVIEDMPA